MSITRGGNGQVESINGRPGRILAWLALIQPAVLILVCGILVSLEVFHFKEHRMTDQFTTATLLRLGSLEDGQAGIKAELKEVRAGIQKTALAVASMDTAIKLLLDAD